MIPRPTGLAARLLLAQVLVIGIGATTLVLAATLVAPVLFSRHMARSGDASPSVLRHAEEAFVSSFAIALILGMITALATAGIVSWFVVRRITAPVAQLAGAADAIAHGDYRVQVPRTGIGSELDSLSLAFEGMAARLADTDRARTRLLADLSHELRTPLATLEAHIDGMEDGVVPLEPASWETMRDQVGRLRRLATDVREAAAAGEHALGLVLTRRDANDLATIAVTAAQPRYLAAAVSLSLRTAAQPAMVAADAERLQQVLANLLDNALRHTPAGGHVAVRVVGRGDSTQISVTDDGDGLPVDQLEAVFERFHRVDPARASTGSGLGLTIARAIVSDHGGSLVADSPGIGAGCVFTVTLPPAPSPGRR